MNKKTWLDELHYNHDKQQGNLELAYAYKDKEGTPKFSKWKKYLDVQADDKFLEKANNRSILPNEVVLDIEDFEHVSEILGKLVDEFEFYSAYKTGSRGVHFHLFFNKDLTSDEKLFIIKRYGADEQKASERCLIALENVPHWKTGNLKELIEEKKGFNDFENFKNLLEKEKKDKFGELKSEDLTEILGLTIKKDNVNKLITFLGQLSAYTEDSQINISNNAPSSTGKSYIPLEISEYFPKEGVIVVGYCSPTAFFHDVGEWSAEKKQYVVNLERKILIFLDQPHSLLLQHLRPLLSHDSKEIKLKITDKSQKHGLRTKNIIIRGFPSVIFCTAGLKIDEQEATRFILLSPETNQEKIREAILEKINKESDRDLYSSYLESNPERKLLKERIQAIRDEGIEKIIINEELKEKLRNKFFEKVRILKPRHQRDIGRIISFVKTFSLLNLWHRKRENNTIYSNEDDLNESFSLWNEISESQELNLPPYIYNIYQEVILKIYSELDKGLSRKDISKGYFDTYGRPLPDWLLRQQILPMLENSGLIYQESDPNDKRRALVYPTTQLTVSQEKTIVSQMVGVNTKIT